MTKSTSAWAWLTVGILALGLNGFLHDEGATVAQRISELVNAQTAPVLALASGNMQDLMAKARLAQASNEVQTCRLQSKFIQIQRTVPTEWTRVQVISARQGVRLAQLEANRARIEGQVARFQFVDRNIPAVKLPVVCPRVKLNVPAPVDGNGPI